MNIFLFSNINGLIILAIGGIFLASLVGLLVWREKTKAFWKTYGLWAGLILTLGAIVSSLVFEHVYFLDPCNLCWWQRIFLYPQFFLFGLALLKKVEARSIFRTSLTLSIVGVLFSTYHYVIQMVGTESILCTPGAESCASIDMIVYGFITIPFMAGITFLVLILNGVLNRKS